MAGITPITGISAGGSGGGGGGGVTSVGATSPVVSSGGTTPNISIPAATGSSAGHMTAIQAGKVALLSGTNTGDQTSIVGITGTKAEFNTAVTDGNFLYSGDITQYTDELAQDAVGAMVDSTLVYTDGTPLLSRAALTGEATASAGSNAVTLTNSAVISKVLTGYTSGAGTVAATDTILQAIQKLNGNDAATLTAAQSYADGLVTGLLDFKGSTDTSANPNYPAALKGDAYYVSVAGKIGGASGTVVEVGDVYVASADNAGGTQAAVGSSWFVLEHNLVGALVASNNLSDLASASTARTNLGLGTLATQSGTFSGTSSGTNTGDQTITLTGAVTGSGTGSFATSLGSFSSANLATALTDETGSGSAVFAVAPNLTGFVGINNASAGGSLDVGAAVYNPGTISVNGVNVTGVGTEFTKTFKVGDSITTTTNNGTHTEEIQTITSDTVLTVVDAFTGTNSGATYTSSNTGSQFVVLPNGGIRVLGTTGLSAVNTSDWIYKADTVSYTGSQLHSAFRDRTTYNPTGSSTSTLNSIAAGANLNATGTGGFTNVRSFNAFPTVVATNTGSITNLVPFLSAPQIQSGATGTIGNLIGFSFNSANSSTTNTITNMYGVSLTPTQAGGTLTSYAGVAVAAKPTAATNSSLLLLGTTTIPSGDFAIYNISTNSNYLAGKTGVGATPFTDTLLRLGGTIGTATALYGVYSDNTIPATTTVQYNGFTSVPTTAASAFTLGSLRHFRAVGATIGATSAITDQYGFFVDSTLNGATNNYGFYGNIAAASGRYNLYMAGTADNYLAGSLGIGIAPALGTSLTVAKSLTGAASTNGVWVSATVLSDSTTNSFAFRSNISTQAAVFTLPALVHYYAQQSTFGAGSTVTNQYGYHAESSLIGATNNYGFYGNIASGAGRYNLYMNGTAPNVLNGILYAGGLVGAQSLLVTPVASAVNHVNVLGAVTGGGVALVAAGTDSNIPMNVHSKGTSSVFLKTNAGSQVSFVASPSSTSDVNYVQVISSITANAVNLKAEGTDSNIDLSISAKGTGYIATNNLERNTSKSVVATNTLTAATLSARRTYFTGTAGASFAVTLPSAAAAIDGALITVMSTAARASTTWVSTGATFVGAPSSLTANVPVMFQYNHATTQWFITE